ncbi:hypothetical protein GYB22_11900 [bacterium]|nr:hypothetical protein [bacterium]
MKSSVLTLVFSLASVYQCIAYPPLHTSREEVFWGMVALFLFIGVIFFVIMVFNRILGKDKEPEDE